MTYKVLICDDHEDDEQEWVKEVQSVVPQDSFEVVGASSLQCDLDRPTVTDLKNSIDELLRRRDFLRNNPTSDLEKNDSVFDSTDVLILDYDLVHFDNTRTRHTGEELARLARTFSNCGVIVVINQYRDIQFDLTLRGHISSYADLNLDASLLPTKGLWQNPPWSGFRPWAWISISNAVELQRARQNFVRERFSCRILDEIGMRTEDVRLMSDSAFEFIFPNQGDLDSLAELTFEQFPQEQVSDLDARAVGKHEPDFAAGFIGARIGKWLEREVLGSQDVLVDVPHLIERYPFLLGEDFNFNDLEAWTTAVHDFDTIKEQIPDVCWFKHPEILSRPAVWRHRFEATEDIVEKSYSFEYEKVPAYVFQEDVSQFGRLEDSREFRAGYHNAFDSRHVRVLEGIRYTPQRRFALRE